jgi:hypothetical protein
LVYAIADKYLTENAHDNWQQYYKALCTCLLPWLCRACLNRFDAYGLCIHWNDTIIRSLKANGKYHILYGIEM